MQRSAVCDLLLLTVLCGLTYAAGLTAHGLTNWHEARGVLVAREMGGGIIAFSVLTKAVPRYLTPVWPRLAMSSK